MTLSGNTILISGGTSGIGRALGNALLERDNTVVLLGRHSRKLADAEDAGFHTIYCDISSQQDIEQAVLRIHNDFPKINVLFNNAGIQNNYVFSELVAPLDKIAHEISVNLTGQIILTQLLIPLLATSGKGYIINTTSGLGVFPKANGLVYSAAKAGMRNFTLGLRYGIKNTGIKTLELIPPVTATNMTIGREGDKLPLNALMDIVLPQLERERPVITVPKMRLFLWLAFLFPGLAHRVLA